MKSKPLVSFSFPNPGQFGVNTQDSPLTLPQGYATIAENAIVDKQGRIACRQGNEYVTTTGGTSADIRAIFEAEWADGTTTIFSVGNNKIYTGTTTLTDITGAATITADAWQIAQLQDVVFFFQSGHAPLQYTKSVGSLDEITSASGYIATVQQGTCCLSAFGRLWTALDDTIYWSDLLDGVDWGSGTSGSLDFSTVFPQDTDSVVALAAHNDFLIVFLSRNIVVYRGADNPATMEVEDIVVNVGCFARDSVVNIGSDILFLDRSGVRSLGRVIQEKSAPLGRISRTVNNDIVDAAAAETEQIKAHYSRKNKFVLFSFPSTNTTYCFDTQFPMQDGSLRVTTWEGTEILCQYELTDGTLYFGGTNGIREYSSAYTDDGAAYQLRLFMPHSDLGAPHIIKIGKEMDVVTDGGSSNTVAIKWAYDWSTSYKTGSYTLAAAGTSEFGLAEFGEDEFGVEAGIAVNHKKITGSGRNISVGMETDINGFELAVQEFNLHTVQGRVL